MTYNRLKSTVLIISKKKKHDYLLDSEREIMLKR